MNRKRVLALALLAAALFVIVTRPVESGTFVRETAQETAQLPRTVAESFSTFLSTVF